MLTEEMKAWRKDADRCVDEDLGKLFLHRLAWIKADAIEGCGRLIGLRTLWIMSWVMIVVLWMIDHHPRRPKSQSVLWRQFSVTKSKRRENGIYPSKYPHQLADALYGTFLGRHDRGLLNWPAPWKSAKHRLTAHDLMARNIDYYLFGNGRYRSDLKWYRIY